jgi:hypothetical protein
MPTREEVKPRVVEKLLMATHKPAANNEASDLSNDLVMSSQLKKAMGIPYSNISRSYPAGITVSMTDAGDCTTVKDSIDLVFKRSNGTKG